MSSDEYNLKRSKWMENLGLTGFTLGLLGAGGIMYTVLIIRMVVLPLLFVSFGFLIVGIVFAMIAQFSRESQQGPQMLPKAAEEAATPERTLVISVPSAVSKYTAEVVAFSTFGAIVSLVGGFFVFLIRMGGKHFAEEPLQGFLELPLTQGFLLLVFLGLGIWIARWGIAHSLQESKLAAECKGREFVISDQGLQCSIALFEGEMRDELRVSNEGYLQIPWYKIREFIVQPSRASRGSSIPPYYKIKLMPDDKYVFILRRNFYGREREILDTVRSYISCPITLNDELR